MRLTFKNLFLLGTLLAFFTAFSSALPAPKKTAHKTTSSKHHAKSKHGRAKKTSWKRHGQQGIQPERARAIQEALIREHYLTGDPSGVWDANTQAAMIRYQEDNGWQSKVTPDSRALIKLGLGPDYSQQQILNLPPAHATETGAVASVGGSISSSAAATGASRDKQ